MHYFFRAGFDSAQGDSDSARAGLAVMSRANADAGAQK